MKTKILIAAVTLFFAFGLTAVKAQDKEWAPGNRFAKHYDTTKVETIKGTISSIFRINREKGIGYRLQADLLTDEETIRIHIGPSWFIEEKGFEFNNGDKIEVTGSRVKLEDKDYLIAAEIVKEGKVLKLRDRIGTPLWIGWGEH